MSHGTLYYIAESMPCRTVMAVIRILGLNVEHKLVNLMNQEHLTEEYLKINPFHTVPAFVDSDGFTLTESRAIATYLVQKYKPESSLYPAGDLKIRATVDRFLYYDLGTLFAAISAVYAGVYRTGKPALENLPMFQDKMKLFDEYLEKNGTTFIAANHLTLADLSLYFSLTACDILPELSFSTYKNVVAYFEKVDQQFKPYDQDGVFANARTSVVGFVQSKLSKN